jgi:acetyl-CoA synthetase
MPKKNKIKSKVKKKNLKQSTVRKKVKQIKRKVSKKVEDKELIIKTKPEWLKGALINKTKYQKKYSDSIKNNN